MGVDDVYIGRDETGHLGHVHPETSQEGDVVARQLKAALPDGANLEFLGGIEELASRQMIVAEHRDSMAASHQAAAQLEHQTYATAPPAGSPT